MATTADIDTKSAVRKFLERRTVLDREDETVDTADEVQAVLESVALSFLLYPQSALSFVLRAKNILQQVVAKDLEIIRYLLKALDDVENPDEPVIDTSDLIEAQTALVEVDRIGRVAEDVRAYDRYNQAINRFLDRRLAKSLKRRRRNELERTGVEAKRDLFRVLALFQPTHDLMSTKLSQLVGSVSDFQSVDLTRVVSTKTLTRVRASIRKVIQGIEDQSMSKTAMAIELMAGSSSLQSISDSRRIYDPTISTGTIPTNRTITFSSEVVRAQAVSSVGPFDLSAVATPWVFEVTTDPETGSGTTHQVTVPYVGASGRSYVKAAVGSPTYNIPIDKRTLYVELGGITPPLYELTTVRAIELPTGTVSVADILSALNDGTTGLLDATAVQLGTTGRILIYGDVAVTSIRILGLYRGTFDIDGNYIPADESAHDILGFSSDQISSDPDVFTAAELADLLAPYTPTADVSAVDGRLVVASESDELLSSLAFDQLALVLGFSPNTYEAEPTYLQLVENGEPIDPSSVGVYVGSFVTAGDVAADSDRTLFASVTSIDGTRLFFSGSSLPRNKEEDVRVVSPLVFGVQTLLDSIKSYVGSFSEDSQDLQRVLSPILSTPTLAQVNDARRVLNDVIDRVEGLQSALVGVVVRDDRSEFGSVTAQIVASLEERGLDRSLELLLACQFSSFFAITKEEASKGSRFMKATEEVGRNDFAKTAVEEDMDDLDPTGTTPDDDILTGEELLEDEEQL